LRRSRVSIFAAFVWNQKPVCHYKTTFFARKRFQKRILPINNFAISLLRPPLHCWLLFVIFERLVTRHKQIRFHGKNSPEQGRKTQ